MNRFIKVPVIISGVKEIFIINIRDIGYFVGRGIRPHPEKIKTLIVDLCDNYRRFGKVEDLKLVAPSSSLWHLESNGKQLTNIYYD
jgi:hypothetical protein